MMDDKRRIDQILAQQLEDRRLFEQMIGQLNGQHQIFKAQMVAEIKGLKAQMGAIQERATPVDDYDELARQARAYANGQPIESVKSPLRTVGESVLELAMGKR